MFVMMSKNLSDTGWPAIMLLVPKPENKGQAIIVAHCLVIAHKVLRVFIRTLFCYDDLSSDFWRREISGRFHLLPF